MATFNNQATLFYNGNAINSNTVTGEILEVLSATKSAVVDEYTVNDTVTYVISILNSGNTPFTGVTITDNLGAYTYGMQTLIPLSFVQDSATCYANGLLQTVPATVTNNQLVISNITVPANGNAIVMYEVTVNSYAPLAVGGTITNEAVITANRLATPIEVTETIEVKEAADLTISKQAYPTVVPENGELTYTFVIENSGNKAVAASDNVTITDDFNPILNALQVTFATNNVTTTWNEGTQYTYTRGVKPGVATFDSVQGMMTVPAATFAQDPVTGVWAINPGVSILTISGQL